MLSSCFMSSVHKTVLSNSSCGVSRSSVIRLRCGISRVVTFRSVCGIKQPLVPDELSSEQLMSLEQFEAAF